MKANIVLLPGDGIGPEVIKSAVAALDAVASKFGHQFAYDEQLIGGIAIETTGSPLPDATLRAGEQADAILLAAVGLPKYADPTAPVRPEQGLLKIRSHFGLFANLRPVKTYPALFGHAPLRAELLDGVDMLIVRELTGGLYFGARKEQDGDDYSFDTMNYTIGEIERVAHVAFRAAQQRSGKLTSIDKANVLASMRLWRRTVMKVAEDYADVALNHEYVDAAAMYLMTRPASYDVILAENMFGDILSDEASVLAGSLGMLPSASLGTGTFGLYEPVHGSAPDIAGQGKANPIGQLLSAAMLLRYSLGLEAEAAAIEAAVERVLADGARTADIAPKGSAFVSTDEFTQAVVNAL
ncbi:MAG: 3-isopropylmalate dehydrogenase [Chloroflexi bacterium]|nr:3-isopropylmalate dehydrogenase [Chloroflexota bacterium]